MTSVIFTKASFRELYVKIHARCRGSEGTVSVTRAGEDDNLTHFGSQERVGLCTTSWLSVLPEIGVWGKVHLYA
jgi:hypothetical protein